MAKKAKKKVRTTAQRRAAAKAAWQLRKLREAGLVKPSKTKVHRTPPPQAVSFGGEPAETPTTAGATREGSELYITISRGGYVLRHPLSRDTMRKLGLDCLQLVG